MGEPGKTAIVHYSAPPVVGGVEAVILAHAQAFLQHGFPADVIAGRGSQEGLPSGAGFICLPEMDSQNPRVLAASQSLAKGEIPDDLQEIKNHLKNQLGPVLAGYRTVIVHNILSKHFNLALTAALWDLIDEKPGWQPVAWCHDISWTSSHSQESLHPGYPWDLLRRYDPSVHYVAISQQRQEELAGLLSLPPEKIQVIYNGVDPQMNYGLNPRVERIVQEFTLLDADLILLMPVRVTEAKNIELALQVAAELKRSGESIRMVVTGPPDPHDSRSMGYYRALKARRDQLSLQAEFRFVFELEQRSGEGKTIGPEDVAALYRVADLLFMPSWREGFGMPVLEAGLTGLSIFTTPVPASLEIGGDAVQIFALEDPPAEIAGRIHEWARSNPAHGLKKTVRQNFRWDSIFESQILPLISHD